MSKKQVFILRGVCAAIGFLFAVLAYYPAIGTVDELGNKWDVLYHAFDMMKGADPIEAVKNGWMNWARFICPLSTGVFVISFFSKFVNRVFMWFRSLGFPITIFGKTFGRDSVAIYGSNDLVKSAAAGTHFIQAGDHFLKHAKRHIILMDSDDESQSFYKKHEAELHKDTTYIGLQQMSSFLMQSTKNVFFFNVYEEVARAYWKDCNIRTAIASDPEYNIVILGYDRDNLGYQLLKYGIMNNVFRQDQKITYHIFCKPEEIVRGFEQLKLCEQERPMCVQADGMLSDTIRWYPEQWQKHLDVIQKAARILLCRTINPHVLNQLLLTCTDQQIHYYDPDIASYTEQYAYPYLHSFGCTKKVLNEYSILKRALHRDAVERNFQYEKQFGKEATTGLIRNAEKNGTIEKLKLEFWNDLDGFTKNSNVATSDYYTIHPVQSDLTEQGIEHRAELEHIRWCRFHYLCGWQQGIPENGKRKDAQKRIHGSLIPWDILSEEDREKDRQQVRMEIEKAWESV